MSRMALALAHRHRAAPSCASRSRSSSAWAGTWPSRVRVPPDRRRRSSRGTRSPWCCSRCPGAASAAPTRSHPPARRRRRPGAHARLRHRRAHVARSACSRRPCSSGTPHALAPGARSARAAALCLVTVALAWTMTHTAFTFRYAHLYYREDAEGVGGLDFPGELPPTYFDFAYFAFTVGMCFQVSDVCVTSHQIRRSVLLHAIISFAYNSIILAFVLNLVFGVASRDRRRDGIMRHRGGVLARPREVLVEARPRPRRRRGARRPRVGRAPRASACCATRARSSSGAGGSRRASRSSPAARPARSRSGGTRRPR